MLVLEPPGQQSVHAASSHRSWTGIHGACRVHVPQWVRWGAGSGALAALPLIVRFVVLFRAGWAPNWDEATISWRSWDVFAGNGPLVGPFTMASHDLQHPVFDPGPLLYWALALPVHLSPRTGLLIGVTLIAAASVVIACLAAARVGGRWAAIAVGLGAIVLGWSLSAPLDGTLWNPYAALAPFGASLIVAWAVAAGRLSWWPCLVLIGSFCAQTHLMYAPGSIAVLMVAPPLGVVAARRSRRVVGWGWAAVGLAVGAVCWIGPVWQQLTASSGNLSALWSATSHGGATTGLDIGVRNLSRAVMPPRPVWLDAQPAAVYPVRCHLWERDCFLPSTSAAGAVVALIVLVIVAGLGYRRRQHTLIAIAAVALVADLTAVSVIAGIPVNERLLTMTYIQCIVWVVGAMTWFAIAYAIVMFSRRRVAALLSLRLSGSIRSRRWPTTAVGLLVLAVTAAVVTHWEYRDAPLRAGLGPSGSRTRLTEATDRVAAMVGSAPRNGDSRLAVETPVPWSLDAGMSVLRTAYLLRVHGWTPSVIAPTLRAQMDPIYSRQPQDAVLEMSAGRVSAGARVLGKMNFRDSSGPVQWTVWVKPSSRVVEGFPQVQARCRPRSAECAAASGRG